MTNRNSVILTCSCFRMDKKAIEAFKMLFPNQEVPEVIKGRDRIFKFAETTDNAHIKAISKLSGKFAYYVEMDGDNILEEYNLVTGRRIA